MCSLTIQDLLYISFYLSFLHFPSALSNTVVLSKPLKALQREKCMIPVLGSVTAMWGTMRDTQGLFLQLSAGWTVLCLKSLSWREDWSLALCVELLFVSTLLWKLRPPIIVHLVSNLSDLIYQLIKLSY